MSFDDDSDGECVHEHQEMLLIEAANTLSELKRKLKKHDELQGVDGYDIEVVLYHVGEGARFLSIRLNNVDDVRKHGGYRFRLNNETKRFFNINRRGITFSDGVDDFIEKLVDLKNELNDSDSSDEL